MKSGDSISLPFQFGDGQDVCSVNAAGADNGYMVSTFSVPPSVISPEGDQALYTCPAEALTALMHNATEAFALRALRDGHFLVLTRV